jgi:hypothetical protein
MIRKNTIRVLWPSFLVAGVATGLLFAAVDPEDVAVFGHQLEASTEAVYSIGFLLFWALCALSSALTLVISPRRPEDDGEDDLI